jgi:hypothetical protein
MLKVLTGFPVPDTSALWPPLTSGGSGTQKSASGKQTKNIIYYVLQSRESVLFILSKILYKCSVSFLPELPTTEIILNAYQISMYFII